LGNFSLWFDEADSILSAISPFQVLGMLKAGRVLVMHNLFLNFWKIAGTDEFTLRVSSAIFGVLAIVVLYRIAEYVFDKKTALWSAFLLSISPFNIYYSQELRPYAMMVLLTLCAVYCLVKGLEEKKITYWIGYVVFTVLNFYTHWIASFYFFTIVVYFIIWRRDHKEVRKAFIVSNAVILLLSIPWAWSLWRILRLVFDQDSLFSKISIGWIPAVDRLAMLLTLKNFSAGYSVSQAVAVIAVILYGVFFLRGILNFREGKKIWLVSLLFIFPIAILFGLSKYRSFYVDRYLIASSPFFYLIVSRGLSRIKNFRTSFLILGLFMACSALGLVKQYNNYLQGDFVEHLGVQCKKQERQAAAYVLENLEPGDGILHVSRSSVLPFEFYFKYAGKLKIASHESIKPQLLIFLKEKKSRPAELELCKYSLVTGDLDEHYVYRPTGLSLEDFERVWVIFSGWDFYLANRSGSSENRIIDLIGSGYRKAGMRKFDGINIYLFEKNSPLFSCHKEGK
jgi:hypothetical protein